MRPQLALLYDWYRYNADNGTWASLNIESMNPCSTLSCRENLFHHECSRNSEITESMRPSAFILFALRPATYRFLINPSKSQTILKNSKLKRSLISSVTWGLITSMSGLFEDETDQVPCANHLLSHIPWTIPPIGMMRNSYLTETRSLSCVIIKMLRELVLWKIILFSEPLWLALNQDNHYSLYRVSMGIFIKRKNWQVPI